MRLDTVTIFAALILIGFIIFVRARWKGRISGEDKKDSGSGLDMLDSPHTHRIMMILAMLFGCALLGFALSGIVKRLME